MTNEDSSAENSLKQTDYERLERIHGYETAGLIWQVVKLNLSRGRRGRLFSHKSDRDYLALVEENFLRQYPYLSSIQVAMDYAIWFELQKKLYGWTLSFLYRKEFARNDYTRNLAKAFQAKIKVAILKAHFPYDGPAFDAWARCILKNVCRHEMRSYAINESAVTYVSLDQLEPYLPDETVGPSLRLQHNFDLSWALAQLPPDRQKVIRLLYVDGLSNEEVAEEMNRNTNAVYSLHSKAKKQLGKILGGNGYNEG